MKIFNSSLFIFTLKSWPVIAIATISLCYLTELVAGWFGVTLPEQKNIDIVKAMYSHVFDSWRHFGITALNTALILVILPFVEELVFRLGLFNGVTRLFAGHREPSTASDGNRRLSNADLPVAVFSSVLFSAAHYLAQPFPDNAFIALFFFGFAQCWLYRRTGSFLAAALNHTLFNLTNLVLLLLIK